MNVIIISGSRDPNGQTARAAEAYAKGVIDGGGKCEQFYLPNMDINRCRQCNLNGWGVCWDEHRCIIEDDFPSLVQKIREADAVVFATPVYFSDLSESLRAFLDRLRRTCFQDKLKPSIKGKSAIGICVAGGGGGGAPACCAQLDKILQTCGFEVADMFPVRRQNLEGKIILLEAAGKQLAQT